MNAACKRHLIPCACNPSSITPASCSVQFHNPGACWWSPWSQLTLPWRSQSRDVALCSHDFKRGTDCGGFRRTSCLTTHMIPCPIIWLEIWATIFRIIYANSLSTSAFENHEGLRMTSLHSVPSSEDSRIRRQTDLTCSWHCEWVSGNCDRSGRFFIRFFIQPDQMSNFLFTTNSRNCMDKSCRL